MDKRSLLLLAIAAYLTAACGTSSYGDCPGCSKCGTTKLQISEFKDAIQAFENDTLRFPTTEEGLDALVRNPGNLGNWNGPYLKKGIPSDPWGREYGYKCPGDHGPYDLCSYGSDGIAGTDDDIVNWKPSRWHP
jgi:general secretion pathway protein G